MSDVATTVYQSAFQLAAAINIGLGVFAQIRSPLQTSVSRKLDTLSIKAGDVLRTARSKMDEIEHPLHTGGSIDQARHGKATKIFGDVACASVEVDELVEKVQERAQKWSAYDKFIQTLASVCVIVSLYFLGITTYYPTVVDSDSYPVRFSAFIMGFFSWFVYVPFLVSYIFAVQSVFELSSIEKKARVLGRSIFRASVIVPNL